MNQTEFLALLFPGKPDTDLSARMPLEDLSALCDGSKLPEGAVGFRIVTCANGRPLVSPRYFVGALEVSSYDLRVTESQRCAMEQNGLKSVICTRTGSLYALQEGDVILS